jgi:glucokinase-like ROK family protein
MVEKNVVGSTRIIRQVNLATILDTIRLNGPLSRSNVAKMTGISLPTILRVSSDLLDADLVKAIGKGESTGGRPGELLAFNSSGNLVVGIDLGGTKIVGAIVDLGGNVLSKLEENTSLENTFEQLCRTISTLLEQPRAADQKILGIGVGLPGITQTIDGIVSMAPNLGWDDFPLQKMLKERFSIPVYIENDVNMQALGEYGFGAGVGTRNMIMISFGTGIGSGIIINGALYQGSSQSAGEIGYMIPSLEYLRPHGGGLGALELVASGAGISRNAEKYLGSKNGSPQKYTAKDVFDAARGGQDWAQAMVGEVINAITLAIVNLSVMLDPEVIVLGGGLMKSSDLLFDPIQKNLHNLVPINPRLCVSSLGHDAGLKGAAILVLNAVTESHVLYPITQ